MSTPTRPRAARKSPDERTRDIVGAARELALEEGLAAVTLRAVAARAGVAPALVAHYVPSMESLIASTFATVVGAEIAEVEALVSTLDGPRAQLGTLIRTVLDGSRDDVTVVWVEAWALGRRNETLALAVREQMDAWQTVLQGVIETGVRSGDFETTDASGVAWQVLGMIDGLNAQALVRWGDTAHRGELTLHAVEGLLGLPRGGLG
ncbi:TetR family transcriptional regulator C-terminal domain-containing protein [Agromyces endophyticus]|uniref:TetR/AcrR family transcriptional regulator n=1 Tax=Agromyces sp. H17E-10 TaxID=2932244 RepID=UPI001FCFF02C|nr:TetR family transcriptional regulator C-terminal domain-containing protein [Agromyces sp. H17E-10]UOQ87963.1 TetR family transcriptional regulator C-terminal domain-containing protein [Agromyces sp. H17E-10]